ncbi:MAG: N-6 DNA methylase [Candidatus Cloacimonetes bacterium]|nr:N-6 DNA methylase [Candidatus Cloacimonadota bacterium]
MTNIKSNERELASKISQWFNEQIKRGKYPFTSASCEPGIKVGEKTYFGDIVIWQNREINKAFSYIALKRPFGKIEDIERFREKAVQLKVKIAYTWDFQSLNVYEIKDNKIKLEDSDSRSVLTNIEDWKRGDKQAEIKAFISRICDELLSFDEKGRFRKFTPEKHYFIRFLRNIVNQLIPIYEQFIKNYHRAKAYKSIINKYYHEQGIPFSNEENFYKLIASQRVYDLVTKVIFYLTLKRHFKELPDLLVENAEELEKSIQQAFSIARKIDWHAVFETDEIDEFGIPQEAYQILNDLFAQLIIYNFGALPEDVIGELFEEIIDPQRRHNLGQYFTREDLVDLIIATIVDDKDKFFADPTCGSGTFLIRLYDRLKYLSGNRLVHEEILNKIWGIDISKFPAELSTINLFRQEPGNFENFPRVLKNDIFEVYTGKEEEFPPNTINPEQKFKKIKVNIPEFCGIVGNFPYIKQELIEKNVKGYKKKLSKILANNYLSQYPELFKLKHISEVEFKDFQKQNGSEKQKRIEHWVNNKFLELKLSGQADIYTYIFIHCSTLLSKNGSLAIITSNSWLDASYGSVLKDFFLDHFKIKMIVASWAEPWFDDAAVNTVFTVLEKCDNEKGRNSNKVHFVKLKKKLAELIPERDLKLESLKRWQRVDNIINKVESSQFKSKEIDNKISSFEDEDMRIRLIEQKELKNELKEMNVLSKWGKYLRAPDVYFEIMEKCKDKLCFLYKKIDKCNRGKTPGITDFFFVKLNNLGESINYSKKWKGKIEKCYLKKVIKSPKESKSIEIKEKGLQYHLFVCNKSKEELKKLNHFGALKYIEWGERQKNKNNKPYPEIPSVQGRKYWWFFEIREPSNILWTEMCNDTFRTLINNNHFIESDKFYRIDILNKKVARKISYYLNSTICFLFRELNSFISLGDGVIKTPVYELNNLNIPLNLNEIRFNNEKLLTRDIKSIFEEVKLEDRQELDRAVLKALSLNPDEYLPRIYEGLTEMVKERLELPKMRKKKKKQKIKISYNEVKTSVINEIIGRKLKKFPEDFYTEAKLGFDYESVEIKVYNTSGKELHIDEFINICTLIDEDGEEIFSTKNYNEAKFAVILAKPDVFRLKIPKDEKIVKNILENYKNYVNQLKEQLAANAQLKLHSWNEAEQMAKEILGEYGLRI